MLETGIDILEWPSLPYCTMSAFGGDAWQRKAMSHKSSFIIIDKWINNTKIIVYNIQIYWNVSRGDNHMQNDKRFKNTHFPFTEKRCSSIWAKFHWEWFRTILGEKPGGPGAINPISSISPNEYLVPLLWTKRILKLLLFWLIVINN